MKSLILILLFFTTSAFAAPTSERIQEIKMLANSLDQNSMFESIEFTFDLTKPNPAAASFLGNGKYRVSINKDIFYTLTLAAQDLIGFHEMGHIYLGHTEMDPKLKNRYEVELEADAFAAFMYLRFGEQNKDFFDFINLIESQKETTPPGDVRAKLIKEIINQ